MSDAHARYAGLWLAFLLAIFAAVHAAGSADLLRVQLFGVDGFAHSSESPSGRLKGVWRLRLSTPDGETSFPTTTPAVVNRCVRRHVHVEPMGTTMDCEGEGLPFDVPWFGIFGPTLLMVGTLALGAMGAKFLPPSPDRMLVVFSDVGRVLPALVSGLGCALVGMLLSIRLLVVAALWAPVLAVAIVLVSMHIRRRRIKHDGVRGSWTRPLLWLEVRVEDEAWTFEGAVAALFAFWTSATACVFMSQTRATIPHGIMGSAAGWILAMTGTSLPSMSPASAETRATYKVSPHVKLAVYLLALSPGLFVAVRGILNEVR